MYALRNYVDLNNEINYKCVPASRFVAVKMKITSTSRSNNQCKRRCKLKEDCILYAADLVTQHSSNYFISNSHLKHKTSYYMP